MDGEHLELARARVAALQEQGESERSLAEADTALAAAPGDQRLRALRAQALLDLERPEEALQEACSLIDELPGNDEMHMVVGGALLDLGEHTRVITVMRDVLSRWPVQPLAREYLVKAHTAMGEQEEAIAQARVVLEQFPQVPHSHMLMVEALDPDAHGGTLEDLGAAEYHLRAALDLAPEDPGLLVALARFEELEKWAHQQVREKVHDLTVSQVKFASYACSFVVVVYIVMSALFGFHRIPTAAVGLVLAGLLGWRARIWARIVPAPRRIYLWTFARWWPAGAIWIVVTALVPLPFMLMAVLPQWQEAMLYTALLLVIYGQVMVRNLRKGSAEDHTAAGHRSS